MEGPRIRGDYGIVSNKPGERPVNVGVHRVMYEEAYGPIPDGAVVGHTCGVKLCCNPGHLALARRISPRSKGGQAIGLTAH
jgi:hypothetical protein